VGVLAGRGRVLGRNPAARAVDYAKAADGLPGRNFEESEITISQITCNRKDRLNYGKA